MKLQIDNLDGVGLRDYTADIDASRTPKVIRKLNEASELRFSLISEGTNFIVPVRGARVLLDEPTARMFSPDTLPPRPSSSTWGGANADRYTATTSLRKAMMHSLTKSAFRREALSWPGARVTRSGN
jgi:hypothetical protein